MNKKKLIDKKSKSLIRNVPFPERKVSLFVINFIENLVLHLLILSNKK